MEVNALGSFFKDRGQPRNRYIGSVKTNIGHTESAAGIMGLIKVLLMMKHDTIVPSLHCDTVNPKINLYDHRFDIPKSAIPWRAPEKLAACNSFGFGGSNTHAIVRSYQKVVETPKRNRESETVGKVEVKGNKNVDSLRENKKVDTCKGNKQVGEGPEVAIPEKEPDSSCVVCFSGKSQKSLKGSLENLYMDEEAPLLNVHDVSYTSTVRRDHHPYRAAFVVDSMENLVAAVGEHLSQDQRSAPASSQQNVAFVFCGMGTAWEGMCRKLLEEKEVFRNTMLDVERHLSAYVSWSLTDRIQREDPSKDPILAPIAIFACQVGLVEVWRTLGVFPSCVVGQSIGEVAAAYTAGCLSLADAVRIIYHRSQLLAQVTGGAMVVVKNVEVDTVRETLKKMGVDASVALEYSPRACAISSSSSVVSAVKQRLLKDLGAENEDMALIDLDVAVAYHSHHVDSAADKLASVLQHVSAKAPQVPMVSAVTGSHVESPPGVEYWVHNMRKPVLFRQAMRKATEGASTSVTVALEIGPKPVLKAHMKDLFPSENVVAVPSMARGDLKQQLFLQAVSTLYEAGANINWQNLPTHRTTITDVPRYSFDKRYLKKKTEMELVLTEACDLYRKNHLYVCPTLSSATSFKLLLSPLTLASVYDHTVSGRVVLPGAAYAEAGFAVAKFCSLTQPVAVGVEFKQLLMLGKDEADAVDVAVVQNDASPTKSRQVQMVAQKEGKQLAVIRVAEAEPRSPAGLNLSLIRSRCQLKATKQQMYDQLRGLGFEYGKAFTLLEEGQANNTECLIQLQVNDAVSMEMPGTTIHPCILDCMLQSVMLINTNSSATELLPKSIGKLVVHEEMEPTMYVYARALDVSSGQLTFDVKLLSVSGRVIAELSDFVMQALVLEDGRSLPFLIATQWHRVKDSKHEDFVENGYGLLGKKKIIFITNVNLPTPPHDDMTIAQYNCLNKEHELHEKVKTLMSCQKDAEAVVLVFSPSLTDDSDADLLHTKVVNVCRLIQLILSGLSEKASGIPFFCCTFNAWSSPEEDSEPRPVNPSATVVWGLLRTVVEEAVYPRVTAVELHTSADRLTGRYFQSLLHALTTDQDIADYPEVLITGRGVFVNQLLKVKSSTPLPAERQNTSASLQDIREDAVILSKEAAGASKLYAVYPEKESKKSSAKHLQVRARSFAQPPEKLLNLKLPSSQVLQGRTSSSTEYVVMALEVTGEAPDGSEVASCCPVALGAELSVPTATTLPTSAIPRYQAGDLSKLVLFWALLQKADAPRITILASKATFHHAQLLSLIFTRLGEKDTRDVNIVSIENIQKVSHFNEIVLSLVLVDAGVVSTVAERWQNAQSLISCSCLVTPEGQTVMASSLPEAELCSLDTQLLYHLPQLRRLVPNLRVWVEAHQSLMPEVAQLLHEEPPAGVTADLNCLLQFEELSCKDLSVEVKERELFRKDAAYVVVGGLTGLGSICVEFLAENNAGCIAIINRRAPSADQMTKMGKLSAACHCRINAFQGDVSSVESLKKALESVQAGWPQYQLKGVFMGAAVVQDGLFPTMERSTFEKVISPKVKGAWNLHQLTNHLALDYFVLHSSMTSVFGNQGQANYGAANAFKDGLAFYRRQRGLAAQTINWGPLDTGLLENQDTLKKRLKAMGFDIPGKDEIKEKLKAILLLNWTQSVPAKLDLDAYSERIRGSAVTPVLLRMQRLLTTPKAAKSSDNDGNFTSAAEIRYLEPEQRLRAYEDFVKDLTGRLLNVDVADITNDSGLFDLGLDSVTGMTMVSHIERSTSLQVPAINVLSGEATVGSVARVLDEIAEKL